MTTPMTDNATALQRSGAAADTNFRAQSPSEPVVACKQQTWVEIRLVDADGKPMANEPFRLELQDGTVLEGQLDENGLAGVDGIDPSSDGTLTFPRLEQQAASLMSEQDDDLPR